MIKYIDQWVSDDDISNLFHIFDKNDDMTISLKEFHNQLSDLSYSTYQPDQNTRNWQQPQYQDERPAWQQEGKNTGKAGWGQDNNQGWGHAQDKDYTETNPFFEDLDE